VLLTDPGFLPDATIAELRRLQPRRLVVLGGAAAIGEAVYAGLSAMVADTVRVAGADRFATAAAVAALGFPREVETVYVATGGNFPDALAGVPAAAVDGAPLLLVTPDGVPEVTARQLAALAPRRITVLGGEAAVAPPTLQTLAEHLRR
jgi:putative cell wall-binding protein